MADYQANGDSEADVNIQKTLEMDFIELTKDILKIDSVNPVHKFGECGFDSVSLMRFANLVYEEYEIELEVPIFFNYPSIRELAEYIYHEYKPKVIDYFLKAPNKDIGASQKANDSTFKQKVTKI